MEIFSNDKKSLTILNVDIFLKLKEITISVSNVKLHFEPVHYQYDINSDPMS